MQRPSDHNCIDDCYASSTTICQGTTSTAASSVVVGVICLVFFTRICSDRNAKLMNVTPMVSTICFDRDIRRRLQGYHHVMVMIYWCWWQQSFVRDHYSMVSFTTIQIISCVCPCDSVHYLSPNKVVNGNFSAGNTGFTEWSPNICTCLQKKLLCW